MGPGVAKWLRHCATSRTVPRSNPGGFGRREFFSGLPTEPYVLRSTQPLKMSISPGVKADGAWGWRPTTLVVPNVKYSGALTYPDSLGPSRQLVVCDLYFTLLYFTLLYLHYFCHNNCNQAADLHNLLTSVNNDSPFFLLVFRRQIQAHLWIRKNISIFHSSIPISAKWHFAFHFPIPVLLPQSACLISCDWICFTYQHKCLFSLTSNSFLF
jgi:hypothetical protein